MFCSLLFCSVLFCYVMLCHVMSCHVMSCHVMLCYVMLCYVMLCVHICLWRHHQTTPALHGGGLVGFESLSVLDWGQGLVQASAEFGSSATRSKLSYIGALIRLMVQILQGFIYQNSTSYGSIVYIYISIYIRSCRIFCHEQ